MIVFPLVKKDWKSKQAFSMNRLTFGLFKFKEIIDNQLNIQLSTIQCNVINKVN